MTTIEQITQEVAAMRSVLNALLCAIGPRITREQLCQRRGCHRNTIPALMDRGIIFRPDVHGRFPMSEVVEFEAMERGKRNNDRAKPALPAQEQR